jgi:CsoR family transcriptional regulator, copper-sensing transcriptional repressor
MKIENTETRDHLLTRLNRLEGQIRGIQAMISQDRDCKEILQQLSAVRSAAQAASTELVKAVAADCVLNIENSDQASREELVDDLLFWVGKAPSSV